MEGSCPSALLDEADIAKTEVAKVRQPFHRTQRRAPGTLKKAIQALAKADLDDISESLLASSAAEKERREVLAEFDESRKSGRWSIPLAS